MRVSFDVNYRSKLWGAGGEGLARRLAAAHPSGALEVVLKEGERGSAVLVEAQFFEEDGFEVPEVDPVGAATPTSPVTSLALCGGLTSVGGSGSPTRWAPTA